MKVKPETERSRNYKNSAALIPERYSSGIDRAEWQRPALDGQALYETQMKKTEVLARRNVGIGLVSDSDFKAAAKTKGATVIRSRVEGAVDKQVAGFRPHASALEGLTLEPRTDDIDTNVDRRVKTIDRLLHSTKLSVKGYT